eukprot:UN14574
MNPNTVENFLTYAPFCASYIIVKNHEKSRFFHDFELESSKFLCAQRTRKCARAPLFFFYFFSK